jgi:FkbH-like protein
VRRDDSRERWAGYGMKFTEILERNRELGKCLAGESYRIGLFSNVTISQLKDVLELALRLDGVNAVVKIGNYNTIVQDSYEMADFDALVIFWEAANLIEGLHHRSGLFSPDELDSLAERMEGEINLVLRNAIRTPLVMMNKFSSSLFYADAIGSTPFSSLCGRLNALLEKSSAKNLVLVNLEPIIATVGLAASVDFRQYLSSKSLYSLGMLRAYADAVKPVFLAARGRSKKLLVIDCDNTLWGGTVGEDGPEGVRLGGSTVAGRVFHEVQSLLASLQRDGVLLALCSKNNASEVDAMLESHPQMLLRNEHFVSKKVNWQDKASNLREMAEDLNLGLDSFVFLDDSPFELGLIRDAIPEVLCVQVPAQLSEYPTIVRTLRSTFFSLAKTREDQYKTEMYRQEAERKSKVRQHASVDDYLGSLGLRLRVYSGDSIPIPRVAQLSQKTNQFNLTTRRYTEADIHRILADPNYLVEAFSVADRYGDYGVTGVAVVRFEANLAIVESFLMSCRIIGRNIEYAYFDLLVRHLERLGSNRIRGKYFATPKNELVAGFYAGIGFRSTDPNGNVFEISLSDYRPLNFGYIGIDP